MKSSRSRLPSEGGSQSRTTLKQNGVVNFLRKAHFATVFLKPSRLAASETSS